MTYSFNSLTVPLDIGTWQCELVLSSEFYNLWNSTWDRFASSDKRAEQERQIEDDCRAFDLYFRPSYDFRRLIKWDIDAITSFLGDHLNVAHWNLPIDNAGIERALKQAVADGKLVPIVNRDWRMFAMTFRPTPSPLRWPTSIDSSPVMRAVPYGGGLSTTVSSVSILASAEAVPGDDGGGFDWLGAVGVIAGAALGGGDTDGQRGWQRCGRPVNASQRCAAFHLHSRRSERRHGSIGGQRGYAR